MYKNRNKKKWGVKNLTKDAVGKLFAMAGRTKMDHWEAPLTPKVKKFLIKKEANEN